MIPIREEHCYSLFLLIPANAVLLLSLEVVHMPFLLWKYPPFSSPWVAYPLRSALVLQRLHRTSSFSSRSLACALLSLTRWFVETLNGIRTTYTSISSPRLWAPPGQGTCLLCLFLHHPFPDALPSASRCSGIKNIARSHRQKHCSPGAELMLTSWIQCLPCCSHNKGILIIVMTPSISSI